MPSDLVRHLTPGEREAAWAFARKEGLGGWSPEEYDRFAASGNTGGLLAQRGRRLVGFLLYAIHVEEVALTLVAIYVTSAQRRRGIGSALLAVLGQQLQAAGAAGVHALVGERDLAAQLFLRANGFRAVRVLPAAFAGGADDGYCFERPAAPPPEPMRSRDRCRRR